MSALWHFLKWAFFFVVFFPSFQFHSKSNFFFGRMHVSSEIFYISCFKIRLYIFLMLDRVIKFICFQIITGYIVIDDTKANSFFICFNFFLFHKKNYILDNKSDLSRKKSNFLVTIFRVFFFWLKNTNF